MISLEMVMKQLLNRLRQDYPELEFVAGTSLCWSPERQQVFYNALSGDKGTWGLLHEIGHARLNHVSYASDMDLLKKEAAAWQEACLLGKWYGSTIDLEYIQDCLDTYRDWLYKRSACPNCRSKGIQQNKTTYLCPNCQGSWRVTPSRFCRPYRIQNLT